MSNDGGPAFPIAEYDLKNGHHDGRYEVLRQASGISVRDYFAAKALQGMLAYSHCDPMRGNWHENAGQSCVAKVAYNYADAMLAERNKTNE